jgi:hypothetical protein
MAAFGHFHLGSHNFMVITLGSCVKVALNFAALCCVPCNSRKIPFFGVFWLVRVDELFFLEFVCGAAAGMTILFIQSSTKAGEADLVSTYPLEDAKSHLSITVAKGRGSYDLIASEKQN